MSTTPDENTFFTATRPDQSASLKDEKWSEFLVYSLKCAASFAYGNYLSSITNALQAFGARPDVDADLSSTEQAWLLIQRSALQALAQSLQYYKAQVDPVLDDYQTLTERVKLSVDRDEFSLQRDFLHNPESAQFFIDLIEELDRYLSERGASAELRNNLSQRLYEEITIQCDAELRNHSAYYSRLETNFRETFTDRSAERTRRWRRYRNVLMDNVRHPVFEFRSANVDSLPDRVSQESLEHILVPLEELFVWPVGHYVTSHKKDIQEEQIIADPLTSRIKSMFPDDTEEEQYPNTRVLLKQHVEQWLKAPKYDIQIITGEAGLGKTSFVQMFASEIAKNAGNIVYIPVNELNYRGDGYAWDAIVEYMSAERPDRLGFVPTIEDHSNAHRLLLIIDGLDELSRSGQTAEDAAIAFLESLKDSLRQFNDIKQWRVLVLLAGRPKVTINYAGQFNQQGQIAYIDRFSVFSGEDISGLDSDSFLDLRAQWWKNFRKAINDTDIPSDNEEQSEWIPWALRASDGSQISYNSENGESVVDPINQKYADFLNQPLLSYFVAILLYTDKERFLTVETRSDLFEEMFHFFYHRQSVKERTGNLGLQHIFSEESRYRYLLELIALAAWRRGDRSVDSGSVDELLENDAGARKILVEAFGKGWSGSQDVAPITSGIINSFFVGKRQDQPAGVFEFTHKSFREYLSSSRLYKVSLKLAKGINSSLYTLEGAAEVFFEEFWQCVVSHEVLGFLDEIMAKAEVDEIVDDLKPALEELLSYVAVYGCPQKLLYRCTSGGDVYQKTRSAELLLVALLSQAYKALERKRVGGTEKSPGVREDFERVKIEGLMASKTGNKTRYGDWLHALRGQTESWRVSNSIYVRKSDMVLNMLNGFDFGDGMFVNQDFEGADLANASFKNCNLLGASFRGANLRDADFRSAELEDAIFERANISGAKFDGALYSDEQFEKAIGADSAEWGEKGVIEEIEPLE